MKNSTDQTPKKPNLLFRLAALLVTAALVAGALLLVVYRDRFNLDALERWLSYRALDTTDSGEAAPFTHAGGDRPSFACLDSGILMASSAGARYYSFSGDVYAEEVLAMENPVLSSSGGSGVVYDAGGQSLFLFRGRQEVFDLSLDGGGDLLSARVNDAGWLAVTAQQSGYKGAVTVYDADGGEVIRISLSSTFAVDAALSPDCRTVAVVTVDQEGGAFASRVLFYPVDQTEPSAQVSLGGIAVLDLDYEDGYFTMNYEAIERAIVENQVKLFIQCSPHNPAGRVWTEEELDKVLAICRKHHVLVVSDEIHQDIVIGEHPFVPAAAVAGGKYRDIVLTLNSASKTFNLATLLHSHIIIADEELRKTYDAFACGMNRTEVSIMGMLATMAGYEKGEDWLEGMLAVVKDNYQFLKGEMSEKLPKAAVCALEGSYLVLVDLRAYGDPDHMEEFVQKKCGLGVDYGEWFGENYKGFVRLNLATDPKLVREAVERMAAAV